MGEDFRLRVGEPEGNQREFGIRKCVTVAPEAGKSQEVSKP
jgi:hypothetical protein